MIILILLTSEGRAGKAWKHLNKAMVFLISEECSRERTFTLQDMKHLTSAHSNVESLNFLPPVSKPAVQNCGLCVTVALIDTPKVFERAESVWAAGSNKVWRLTFHLMVLLPHLLNSKVKRDISNYHIWNVILILWPVVFYLLLWEELIKAFCVCERAYVRSVRAQMLEPTLDPSMIRFAPQTFTPRGNVTCCLWNRRAEGLKGWRVSE
jgi:hypothetical protein